jgi:predicted secreted protein
MKAFLVPLAAVLLMACGSASTSAPAQTIVVNQDSAGKTVAAHVGDTIEVRLEESFPVPGSSLTWDVSTSAPSVLKLSKVTRDPAERPRQGTVKYTADFSVTASGEAKLFARGAQTCEAMATCPQKDFTVTIDAS